MGPEGGGGGASAQLMNMADVRWRVILLEDVERMCREQWAVVWGGSLGRGFWTTTILMGCEIQITDRFARGSLESGANSRADMTEHARGCSVPPKAPPFLALISRLLECLAPCSSFPAEERTFPPKTFQASGAAGGQADTWVHT